MAGRHPPVAHGLHAPLPAIAALKVPYAGLSRIEPTDGEAPVLLYPAHRNLT